MRPTAAGSARTGEPPAPSGAAGGRRAAVPALALGGFTAALVNTVPIPLLPSLPQLLDTSPANAAWTVTATLLVAAVCTPVSGRLGDMLGKRRVLLWCLGLMVAGSMLCAAADSISVLIAGRALQGCGAGALPLGLSIMRDEVPRERLGRALAVMSSTVGVGSTIGFPFSAFLSQHADWHVLFWAVAALGAANLLLAARYIPASGVRFGGRFDWPGAAGLAVALVCLLLALSKGRGWGWTSGPTLGALALGVAVALWWVRFELRTAQPLVDLRTSASRPVLATNAATLLVGFAMFVISLVLPHVLQAPSSTGYGAGFSMVETGLLQSVAGVVMMAVALLSPAVSTRWGARATLVLGALVIAAGYATGIPLLGGGWWLSVLAVIVGAGLALAFAAMPALIVAATPHSQTAAANGLNTLVRSIGASVASAVVSAVLAALTTTASAADGGGVHPSAAGLRIALIAAVLAGLGAALAALFVPKAAKSD
ncbi:MFS transporter [Kitasatospora sp. NPDC058170]|uniref:MFS transporter n=1 Tax=Kitasatospora sp. NPDC058170 TaxID=3346364 RepID=UPI0036D7FF75